MDRYLFAATTAVFYVVLVYLLVTMGSHLTQVFAMVSLLFAIAGQWAAQDREYYLASIASSYAAFAMVALALLTYLF